jgi:glycosyltransferase involved in cell wall biosynthesis
MSKFDGVLAYDAVTATAFRAASPIPVAILQGGFDPTGWKQESRDWFGPRFGFCMLGQLHSRKDPFVAVQAFTAARGLDKDFADQAFLSLKTTAPGLHKSMEEAYPRVKIYREVWPKEMVRRFYADHHVLVAPSRGEGKNMPALEFMATGGAVIATGWGGHSQWLHPSYAYSLDYTLAPESPDFPKALQARASVEHLRDLMLHTFHHRSEVRDKADLAAEVIPRLCSWDSVVRRLFESTIKEFKGGQQVADLAAACRREVRPVER